MEKFVDRLYESLRKRFLITKIWKNHLKGGGAGNKNPKGFKVLFFGTFLGLVIAISWFGILETRDNGMS